MSKNYDNWGKLVTAVMRRNELWYLASLDELTSGSSSTSSIGGSSGSSTRIQPVRREGNSRRTDYRQEKDFVGLDGETKELISQLVNRDIANCCHVVSIIGKGGIGKTALARSIYHHRDTRAHFRAFAWATVSSEKQMEEVLRKILCKLVPEKREEISRMRDRYELTDELFQVQKTKKCLVVLDNVCGIGEWDRLRLAFSSCKSGSKVLVTTREKKIALRVNTDTSCYMYEQRYLNEEESWELLQKKAFGTTNIAGENQKTYGSYRHISTFGSSSFRSCRSHVEGDEFLDSLDTLPSEDDTEDIEELGKEMVRQCGGLPLAIVLLGGILMTKCTLSEWNEVHQSCASYLRERGIGEIEKVYEKLAINYHALPYQMKQCFWYLGNFPGYYNISTRKLSQLWAAEGFILPGEEGKTTIEIAENFLIELEKRYLVRVQRKESTSRLKYCQLHEFTREICIFKGNEENSLKRISLSHASTRNKSSATPSTHIDSFSETILISEQENIEQVRSALVFSRSSERKDLQSILKWLLDNCKLLRVLDLERFDFGDELCKSIGNLIQLRYLSFRGSRFTKLPSSIGNLKSLQTLDLRVVGSYVYLTIPDVLWKLNDLRHLYLPPQQSCTNKLQLGSLRNLEILKNFDPRVSEFADIPKLAKLKKLTVLFCCGTENLKAVNKYLSMNFNNLLEGSSICVHQNFNSLKELALLERVFRCAHVRKLDLVGQIEKLPEHCHFSESLTKLTLRNCILKEDPLPILQKLPKLCSLTLCNNAYVGNTIHSSVQGFSELRTIQFQGLGFLDEWIVEDGSMPNLLHITIANCTRLRSLPEGIKYLGKVMEIEIINMPEAFKQTVESVQVAGCNSHYKVTYGDSNKNSNSESNREHGGGSNRARLFRNFSPSIPREWQINPC